MDVDSITSVLCPEGREDSNIHPVGCVQYSIVTFPVRARQAKANQATWKHQHHQQLDMECHDIRHITGCKYPDPSPLSIVLMIAWVPFMDAVNTPLELEEREARGPEMG